MVIRVPMKFKRDRGRKQVIAPTGLEGPVVFSRGQAQQALVLALARAHRWSRMLERGEVPIDQRTGRAAGRGPSLIGRTLRLATLAPDITQAILAGQEPYGLSIRRLTKGLPSANSHPTPSPTTSRTTRHPALRRSRLGQRKKEEGVIQANRLAVM
jgi:hypothetical protein